MLIWSGGEGKREKEGHYVLSRFKAQEIPKCFLPLTLKCHQVSSHLTRYMMNVKCMCVWILFSFRAQQKAKVFSLGESTFSFLYFELLRVNSLRTRLSIESSITLLLQQQTFRLNFCLFLHNANCRKPSTGSDS